MLRAKYDRKLAAGVCAAGATLDSLIPPSTLLVVYGIITEQSIGKLLVAGFVPGIVSAIVYAMIITYRCWRQPELGPRITGYTWLQRAESLPATTPIFLVILIIFLSMYFGWATPTEAGALGAFAVFGFALKNGIKRGELRQCLLDSAKLTVMIFTVIWGVLIFVRFLASRACRRRSRAGSPTSTCRRWRSCWRSTCCTSSSAPCSRASACSC
jgi:TRAP-type C4-dicarboxylate transport system permease large subunit